MRPSPNARVMLARALPAASCWHTATNLAVVVSSLRTPFPAFPQGGEKLGRGELERVRGPLFSLMRLWGVVRRLWSPLGVLELPQGGWCPRCCRPGCERLSGRGISAVPSALVFPGALGLSGGWFGAELALAAARSRGSQDPSSKAAMRARHSCLEMVRMPGGLCSNSRGSRSQSVQALVASGADWAAKIWSRLKGRAARTRPRRKVLRRRKFCGAMSPLGRSHRRWPVPGGGRCLVVGGLVDLLVGCLQGCWAAGHGEPARMGCWTCWMSLGWWCFAGLAVRGCGGVWWWRGCGPAVGCAGLHRSARCAACAAPRSPR